MCNTRGGGVIAKNPPSLHLTQETPQSSVVALISEFVKKCPYPPYKCHPYEGDSPPIPYLIPDHPIILSLSFVIRVCHHWKIPVPAVQVSPPPHPPSPISHFPQITPYLTWQGCCTPIRVPILRTILYILFRLQQSLLLMLCVTLMRRKTFPPSPPSDPPIKCCCTHFRVCQKIPVPAIQVSPLWRGDSPPSPISS